MSSAVGHRRQRRFASRTQRSLSTTISPSPGPNPGHKASAPQRRYRSSQLCSLTDCPQPLNYVAVRVEHPHLLIGLDEATVDLRLDVFETEALREWRAARAHHASVDLEGLDELLGVGIDHFDGDWLDARNA